MKRLRHGCWAGGGESIGGGGRGCVWGVGMTCGLRRDGVRSVGWGVGVI